jgi:hypothetical protein
MSKRLEGEMMEKKRSVGVIVLGILSLANWARVSLIIISTLTALFSIVLIALFKSTSGVAV